MSAGFGMHYLIIASAFSYLLSPSLYPDLVEHAPITQMVFVLVILLSTALKTGSVSLDLFHVLHGEVWRLITSFFVFQNSAQTIVGLILLYTCRQFERQMGSKKFGAFLIFASVVSTLLCIAMIVVASSIGFYLVPSSGPFALIFALMINYFWHIPKLHATQYSFAGLDLSEKSWIYLLALQLLLSDGLPSALAAGAGLLVGYLYEVDGYGLQSWRLPHVIERAFEVISGFFGALIPQPSAAPARAPNAATGAAAARPGANNGTRQNLMMDDFRENFVRNRGNGNGIGAGARGFFNDLQQFQPLNEHGDFAEERARAPATPPSEEAIETLMGMGFERDAVVRALQATGNNVEAAANSLLR